MNKKPKLILITGGTASGKTTISKLLMKELSNKKLKIFYFSIDYYYYESDKIKEKMGDKINYDVPDSINWDYLHKDLDKLFKGEIVKKSKYNYVTNNYSRSKFVVCDPSEYDFIIYEGIFSFNNKKLFDAAFLKIFVDIDNDERLIRRIKRDITLMKNPTEKIKWLDKFFTEWKGNIMPSYYKYTHKLKNKSDLILNYQNDNKQLIKMVYHLIKDKINNI